MNISKQLFVMLLVMLATACGSAKFSGKGGKKSSPIQLVDQGKPDPTPCESTGTCTSPCSEQSQASSSTSEDQSPVQNANGTEQSANQSESAETSPSATIACPVVDTDNPSQH